MAWGRMLLIRYDPWVNAQEAQAEYGIEVIEDLKPNHYDAIKGKTKGNTKIALIY